MTTLVSLLDTAGLAATFQNAGTYTVFAPTNGERPTTSGFTCQKCNMAVAPFAVSFTMRTVLKIPPKPARTAAFAKLPAPIVDWLTNARTENRAALTSTLTFHALGSVVNSGQVGLCRQCEYVHDSVSAALITPPHNAGTDNRC